MSETVIQLAYLIATALFIFSLKLNLLPSYGISSFKNQIMPALAISIPPAAMNMRFTKSSMLESIR